MQTENTAAPFELRDVKVRLWPDPDGDSSYPEFGFVGVDAAAEIMVAGTIQTVTSGGLRSIESDSDADHFAEVGREELHNLSLVLEGLGAHEADVAYVRHNATPGEMV